MAKLNFAMLISLKISHNYFTKFDLIICNDKDFNYRLARNKIRSNSIQKEILGERPKHKFSQFLKTNFNKDGLKTLLIDLDETLVHSSFTQVAEPDFILSVRFEIIKILLGWDWRKNVKCVCSG